MPAKITLVLGASPKPDRYSHLAVRRLLAGGHPVIAVAYRASHIGDLPIVTEIPEGVSVDTVTFYLNANNQRDWEDRLLALKPKRFIFNPGAENHHLAELARKAGIEVVNGCTLVMLASGLY
ncbi:MAG: CoA-binding protein [Flavobacteriales bacterium]|nr:CoA-binding protein [Flavobacteriales bacterium]MCB0813939.1 CoA-binding protein [Flavobacteriales bacterium]